VRFVENNFPKDTARDSGLQKNIARCVPLSAEESRTEMPTKPPDGGLVSSSASGTDQPPRTESSARFAALRANASINMSGTNVGSDILYGADAIACFLFNDAGHRRRVYNLVNANALPIFRIGATICARKSVLLQWIEKQERTLT
jgi:hypothetical protein